jgi:hypothetical protein
MRLSQYSSKFLRATCFLALLYAIATGCTRTLIDSETQQYSKKLSISRVKAFYYVEPKTQLRYPVVQGSISNLGNRTLEVVELTFLFKDRANQVIFKDHGYPVFVSSYSSNPHEFQYLPPAKSIPFAFKSLNCPQGWQEGQVEIQISKVVFAKTN